jgi:hypothetical protein
MTAASVALWTLLAGPSRPARVLEIHDGTVYLHVDPLAAAESRDGRDHPGAVLALLRPDAVRLPIGLVLPPEAAGLIPVSVAGAPVSRGEISIGWGAITLDKVRWPILNWWNPGIPALPVPAVSITAAVEELAADPSGVEPSRVEPSRVDRLGADLLGADLSGAGLSGADRIDDLAAGLAALAAGDAETAVQRLIGLPGADRPDADRPDAEQPDAEQSDAEQLGADRLGADRSSAPADPVPAGDDVLSGALAALAAWAPDAPSRQTLARAVADAADRTTMISAALLHSAAAGFAVPPLVRYLTALSTDGSDVDPAFAELTAVGGVSGSAMAHGVAAQLRALHAGQDGRAGRAGQARQDGQARQAG